MFFQPAVFDGERKGEDIAFCKRWRKTGGDIWLLVDAPLSHEGPTRSGELQRPHDARQDALIHSTRP